ncbi:hypothetical protein [Litorisediminicola beolgyonensis]|uniref:Uncharacterized protein n=1 Tax=Litorisediminicola beolgyonensis TaxID=1173614 RepID=A0ABW3ZIV5_9RHOB
MDRAISEEALLQGLADIRLPSEAAGGLVAELLAALGLGIALALCLGLLLRLMTTRRSRRPTQATDAALPEDDEARALALLRRLKARDPARAAALAPDLYRPGGLPAVARLEEALARD